MRPSVCTCTHIRYDCTATCHARSFSPSSFLFPLFSFSSFPLFSLVSPSSYTGMRYNVHAIHGRPLSRGGSGREKDRGECVHALRDSRGLSGGGTAAVSTSLRRAAGLIAARYQRNSRPPAAPSVAAPSVEVAHTSRRLLRRRGDLLGRLGGLGGARFRLRQRAACWDLQPPTRNARLELVELVAAARRGSRCGRARLAARRR